jgi:hypothetical protein
VTAIETKAGAMVTVHEPETEFIVAFTVTVPLAVALSTPLLEIVARTELDELHVTDDVRSLVPLSL